MTYRDPKTLIDIKQWNVRCICPCKLVIPWSSMSVTAGLMQKNAMQETHLLHNTTNKIPVQYYCTMYGISTTRSSPWSFPYKTWSSKMPTPPVSFANNKYDRSKPNVYMKQYYIMYGISTTYAIITLIASLQYMKFKNAQTTSVICKQLEATQV